jgi:Dynamin family
VTETRSPAPPPTPALARSPRASRAVDEPLGEAASLLSAERAAQACAFVDRWRERLFVVLIAGEFKRGKSTLLNALAGVDLLPTGVLPVTTVPTRVQAGPGAAARVRFRDGACRGIRLDEICDYVDESRNPGNRLGVATVEVELSLGLPPGVVLVDVPGLGSSHRHNTEAALAALPEADAALVVASVDPPVGEAELRLLDRLRRHAPAWTSCSTRSTISTKRLAGRRRASRARCSSEMASKASASGRSRPGGASRHASPVTTSGGAGRG